MKTKNIIIHFKYSMEIWKKKLLSWCIYGHIFDVLDRIRCMNISTVTWPHIALISVESIFFYLLKNQFIENWLQLQKHCNATAHNWVYIWNVKMKRWWWALSTVITVCTHTLLELSLQQIAQTQKKILAKRYEITFTSFTGIMFVKIANKTILLLQRICKKNFFFCFISFVPALFVWLNSLFV